MSTTVQLKCNAGKVLPKVYYQYPNNPGDIEILPPSVNSFLKEGSIEHWIFLEILPDVAGLIVFIFFLISSSYIVYGIVRHIYTDRMIPHKRKMLKKLGKHPAEKRRKRFRGSAKTTQSLTSSQSRLSLESESVKSRSYGKILTATDKPFYLDELSGSSSESESNVQKKRTSSIRNVISFTSPPMKEDLRLPTVPQRIELPGEEAFPVLPDVPRVKAAPPSKPVMTSIPNRELEKYNAPKPYYVNVSPNAPFAPTHRKSKAHVSWDSSSENPADPQNELKPKANDDKRMGNDKDEELQVSARSDLERLIQRRQDLHEQWAKDYIGQSTSAGPTDGHKSGLEEPSYEKPKTHPQAGQHQRKRRSLRKSKDRNPGRKSVQQARKGPKRNSKTN